MPQSDFAPVSPVSAAMMGHCPHCGQGKLFAGFIDLAAKCEVCGLDYGFADAGDGPAVFVSFAAGLLVVGVALIVDILYAPSIWVHILISLPLTLVLCLGLLRPSKGIMIGLQYRNKAEQGTFEP